MSGIESARSDLAFLRDLVDEDWRPGVWGFGATYLAVGVVLIAHMLLSWSVARGLLPLQGGSLLAAYVLLYSLFGLASWLTGLRSRKLFGVTGWSQSGASVMGRTGATTLAGVFIAHLVILVSFLIAAWRRGDDQLLELLPVTLFALQGVVWLVVHAMRRVAWHGALAWAWFAASILAAVVAGTEWLEPFVALAALLLMVLPGVVMVRSATRNA
jgi:hypothetical protein